MVWRGYFVMPLYGRIERARDPVSFWVFVGLIGLFSAAFVAAAFLLAAVCKVYIRPLWSRTK